MLTLLFILANVVQLTVESFVNEVYSPTGTDPLNILEKLIAVFFLLEFVIKIFAYGAILEEHTYFRNYWNILDFVIAMIGISAFFPISVNISILRTLRVLRPLKTLNAAKGIKILVGSLFESLPELVNVFGFILFIMVLFGVIGI